MFFFCACWIALGSYIALRSGLINKVNNQATKKSAFLQNVGIEQQDLLCERGLNCHHLQEVWRHLTTFCPSGITVVMKWLFDEACAFLTAGSRRMAGINKRWIWSRGAEEGGADVVVSFLALSRSQQEPDEKQN